MEGAVDEGTGPSEGSDRTVELDMTRLEESRLEESRDASLPDRFAWMSRANCLGMNPSLFFPTSNERIHPAVVKACAGCGVRDECLAYGMKEPEGIYGGLSGHARKSKRRRESRRPKREQRDQ